jgi:hypothetical protein
MKVEALLPHINFFNIVIVVQAILFMANLSHAEVDSGSDQIIRIVCQNNSNSSDFLGVKIVPKMVIIDQLDSSVHTAEEIITGFNRGNGRADNIPFRLTFTDNHSVEAIRSISESDLRQLSDDLVAQYGERPYSDNNPSDPNNMSGYIMGSAYTRAGSLTFNEDHRHGFEFQMSAFRGNIRYSSILIPEERGYFSTRFGYVCSNHVMLINRQSDSQGLQDESGETSATY